MENTMNMNARFDARAVFQTTTSGRTSKRAARRTVTTIASGRCAFGNAEMRALFRNG
jgi:hypothetical protein